MAAQDTSSLGWIFTSKLPTSPPMVMQRFVSAYGAMDIVAYGEILAPDFEMLLQPGTTAQFPELGAELDSDEELTIHAGMF